MLILVDTFGASFVIYVVGMVEVSVVAWVYGLSSLDSDIRFMLKRSSLSIYWRICWGFIIPGGLGTLLAYSAIQGLDLPPFPPYALGKQCYLISKTSNIDHSISYTLIKSYETNYNYFWYY